jgi:hypothetical protein
MVGQGTSLIWSPRTNISLYGHTASVTVFDRLGGRIGLGSDWVRSGSMNMLRELRCADEFNTNHLGGHFSDKALFDMATINNARLSGYGDDIGSIKEDKLADITIYRGTPSDHYRAVLEAETADVALVLRAGVVQYGDAALVSALPNSGPTQCETVVICEVSKRLCLQREIGLTLESLTQQASTCTYPTYPPFFCDTPEKEPTCTPFRPGEFDGQITANDLDGDGIANEADNCPSVFNAPRPLDGDAQVDADGDLLGDACDPCPFDANTEACTSIDPLDLDGDGVPNTSDNCSKIPNPGQEDVDQDGKGTLCDACDGFANPGTKGCPATIYDIKKGVVALGSPVVVLDAVVTAHRTNGFYMQVPQSSPSYNGGAYGGIFVFIGNNPIKPVRGDAVRVAGVVTDFFGQTQIADVNELQILASNQVLPPVTTVLPGSVATAGSDAEVYEGSLIRVNNVAVTQLNPSTPEAPPTNEFVVTGGLLVNDYFYNITPKPVVGDIYTAITGILRFDWSNTKIEPRDAADVIKGTPGLVSFGPQQTFITEGATGVTSPSLVIQLSSPAPEPVFVNVVSLEPSVVQVVDGGVFIDQGESQTVVLVSAIVASDEPVELVATLGPSSLSAFVTVTEANQVPKLVALDPATAAVATGGELTFTAILDIPAGPGGAVVSIEIDGPDDVFAPASVTVPAGALSADFVVTASESPGEFSIIASSGGGSAVAEVTVLDLVPVGFLIVEVYYDAPNEDGGFEWIKLYNGTPDSIDLSKHSLGWGGNDYTYGGVQLVGTLPPGQCFIVGGPQSVPNNGSPVYNQAVDLADDIQNSGATADGVALFNVPKNQVTKTTVPIDAVLYGTNNTNNLLGPSGSAAPVNVGDAPSGSSLLRTSKATWVINPTPNSQPCPAITQ